MSNKSQPYSYGAPSDDANSLKSRKGMLRDEKRELMNHNSLISRFHNYVNQHQIQTGNNGQVVGIAGQTPQKTKVQESRTPQQSTISKSSVGNTVLGQIEEPQIIN